MTSRSPSSDLKRIREASAGDWSSASSHVKTWSHCYLINLFGSMQCTRLRHSLTSMRKKYKRNHFSIPKLKSKSLKPRLKRLVCIEFKVVISLHSDWSQAPRHFWFPANTKWNFLPFFWMHTEATKALWQVDHCYANTRSTKEAPRFLLSSHKWFTRVQLHQLQSASIILRMTTSTTSLD